jgi:3-hydroxyacyl-CoA dehydrogenase (EC 1.1.1.35)
LDIPGKEDRNEYAKRGLERALKAKPAAFMDADLARYVEIGNTEDHLEKLKDCDWVVEAIIEKPEPKQALYARLEGLLKPTAIVSSNTSGIPMKILLEGRSEAFRKRFLGTHFFNPPRYLHLLELIPTPETDPRVLEEIRRFGERILGKGTVLAKDSPGFIANRLGVYGMVQAVRLMEKHGLTIDEVDALTGPLLGRPNSATFRTADLTGLDVLKLVTEELAHATGEDFALPAWVLRLVEEGRLGEKTGAGFYKRVNGEILVLDPRPWTTFPGPSWTSPSSGPSGTFPFPSASPRSWGFPAVRAFLQSFSPGPPTTPWRRLRRSPTTWSPWTKPWSGALAGRRGPLTTWTPWA